MRRQRVLLGVQATVGRDQAPASIKSASGLRVGHRDVDVVVIDETRSDPVRAAALRTLSESLDIGYYRSPRILGTARGLNLVLLRALTEGYDHVVVVDSEAVIPLNLVDALVTVAERNSGVGSVTAWSDEPANYAIPNQDTSGLLRRQDMVDWISSEMARFFGPAAIDLPASRGLCMLLPVPVVRRVGLFDPLYGRGNLKSVDWTLRSRAHGFRAVLAPSAFVSSVAGDPAPGGWASDTGAVAADQRRVIDLRHPTYGNDLQDFADAGAMTSVVAHGLRALIVAAAARWGYDVHTTALDGPDPGERVVVRVSPDGKQPAVRAHFCGFRMAVEAVGDDIVSTILDIFGRPPSTVDVLDRGPNADRLFGAWEGVAAFRDRHMYPLSV